MYIYVHIPCMHDMGFQLMVEIRHRPAAQPPGLFFALGHRHDLHHHRRHVDVVTLIACETDQTGVSLNHPRSSRNTIPKNSPTCRFRNTSEHQQTPANTSKEPSFEWILRSFPGSFQSEFSNELNLSLTSNLRTIGSISSRFFNLQSVLRSPISALSNDSAADPPKSHCPSRTEANGGAARGCFGPASSE